MPVWHELTAPWRADGTLTVVGITQEQHPERCALFAQWQGFDWPILWDPLNLNGSAVVPRLFAVDEHGVVRSTRPRPDTFESDFLTADFEAPDGPGAEAPAVTAALLEARADDLHTACAELLFGDGDGDLEDGIDRFERLAATPADLFRAGVAYRMRADSPRGRPGDFQRAVDHWAEALAANPNQYIWRRRLQQYGPRLDKPYPFYDWVERARTELLARGDVPVELRAPLTGSETALALRSFEAAPAGDEPDPEGEITRDEGHLLEVEPTVSFHTGSSSGARPARVHLALRPVAARDAHWNNEAEPLEVWLDLPEGWQADRRALRHPGVAAATDAATRHLDFELRPPDGAVGSHVLTGYALFYACEGETGECVYRRRDFEVAVDLD